MLVIINKNKERQWDAWNFIFKLYLLLFAISTIYAIFTLDDLYHKSDKYKDTEDVISRIILNDDSVYFIGKLANYEFKREKNTGFDELPLRYPIILFMFIFMTQWSEKTLMIPYQPIQQSI